MNLFASSCHLLVVASIWFAYRLHQYKEAIRCRRLRDRVAYMLWVTANMAAD